MLGNAGIPLLWTTYFALIAANVVLGVLEACWLTGCWRGRLPVRAWLLMLAANLASTAAGAVALRGLDGVDISIENLRHWFWGSLLAAFWLTVLVEWPFVRAVLAVGGAGWAAAFRATLRVHCLSYPVLVLVGLFASDVRVLTRWSVVALDALTQPGRHVVFHVDRSGRELVRRDLAGGVATPIASVPQNGSVRALVLQQGADGTVDLLLQGYFGQVPPTPVCLGLEGLVAPVDAGAGYGSGPFVVRRAILPPAREPAAWPSLGFSSLLRDWQLDSVTELDSDLFVLALAPDQIVLARPSTQEIALVARGGRCAVAGVRQGR